MSGTTEKLVSQLAAVVDADRVLEDLGLSAAQAVHLLCGKRGRRILATRRRLAKIHADILSNRYSAFAVHRIVDLLNSDKQEMRLKGALSVLELAQLGKKSRRAAKQPEVAPATPEEVELVALLARVMNEPKEEPLEVVAKALPAARSEAGEEAGGESC